MDLRLESGFGATSLACAAAAAASTADRNFVGREALLKATFTAPKKVSPRSY